MKPHRLSDLLTDLCRRINPAYSPGRQRDEFAEALEAAGIRPEHGNRGEERESVVLVDAGELASLRAERDALCSQLAERRVVVPEPTGIVVDLPERYREHGADLVRQGIAWARKHIKAIDPATECVVPREPLCAVVSHMESDGFDPGCSMLLPLVSALSIASQKGA